MGVRRRLELDGHPGVFDRPLRVSQRRVRWAGQKLGDGVVVAGVLRLPVDCHFVGSDEFGDLPVGFGKG